MSHLLNIDNIIEKLILLEHFSHGSKTFSELRLLGSEKDVGDGALDEHWGWLKSITCNYLVDVSVKYRILEDTIRAKTKKIDFKSIDENICKKVTVAQVLEGNVNVSLREMSNKIIHATKVQNNWAQAESEEIDFKYWNGEIVLEGTYHKKNWKVKLFVPIWSKAMQEFIEVITNNEEFWSFGQDWY